MPHRRDVFHLAAGATAALLPIASARAQSSSRFTVKVLGDPDAPVELREYSSLTCPHCASWHQDVLPSVKRQYIDTGKVRLVYRDFPLNLSAWLASAVAHCAGDDGFFAFIDVLYAEQRRWSSAPTTRAAQTRLEEIGLPQMWLEAGRNQQEIDSLMRVAGVVGALVDLAQFGGLAPEQTARCLADFELLDWILAAQQEGQEQFDVQATPTLIIDGRKVEGARSPEAMARLLDAALEGG